MARLWTIGIFAFALTCTGFCQSQADTYRIQEEDRLAISVFDENQIQAEVIVTPDGKISAPFAGVVVAAGKTTSQLEAELANIYESKLRLKNPKVSVTIRSVRKILATVTGSVQRPNTYEMRPGQTVSDLAAMGGVSENNVGDLRRASFKRKGWSEFIPLDLYSLMTTGNLSQNYEIKDGDTINVPPKKDYIVKIWGEVNGVRSVEYQEGMDLVGALTAAGGPNSKAKQTKVAVVRLKPGTIDQYYMIECNLVAINKKQDYAQNIKLLPGDTVYVPNNGNPDFSLFNSLANALFILDRVGLGFGFLKGGN